MQIALYSKYNFMDQNVLNLAQALLYGNWTTNNAYYKTPGVANGSSLTISTTGLVVGLNAVSPMGVLFSSGVFAQGYGTTNGASSSVYNTDLTSFVPGGGSQTVFLVAQAVQVSEAPLLIVGPPPGHPDYDPTFSPATAFTQTWDSFSVSATLTTPNNTTAIELARVTLTAGQLTIPASSVVKTSQLQSSSYAPLYGLLTGNNPWSGVNTFSASSVFTGAISSSGNNVWTGTNSWSSSGTFTGPVTSTSTLNVSGAVILGSTFNVIGATTLASTLNVSGAGTFASTLGASGAFRTNGTITSTATAGTNAFSGTVVVPTGNFPGVMLANNFNEGTVFLANGNFTPLFTGNYLVYAVGGGGGAGGAGGGTSGNGGEGGMSGGGGSIVFAVVSLTAGTPYAVVIGTGGSGGGGGNSSGSNGSGGNPGNATTFGPTASPLVSAAGGPAGASSRGNISGIAGGWHGQTGGGYGGGAAFFTSAGNGHVGGDAQPNTGGGGGGGSGASNANVGGNGGQGGSGILIVIRA